MTILKLLYLNLRHTFLQICQQLVILPIYRKYPIWKIDLQFFLNYWNKNPFRICKRYFLEQFSSEVDYGDTWPLTIYQLSKSIGLKPSDIVYELGSGIGRASFWFQVISGCRVVAIELIPQFVDIAKKIQNKLQNYQIEFIQDDFLNIDYQKASVIYFYGTSFSDEMILKLAKKWESLKAGTKVITTSFEMNEYDQTKSFELTHVFDVSYPWGKCQVYLQTKK